MTSLNMNNVPAITSTALTNRQRNAPKPKYNAKYLISKGNNLTKNNRTKVIIQQLTNYIKTSNNPSGVRAAKIQLNQLMGNRKTRKR